MWANIIIQECLHALYVWHNFHNLTRNSFAAVISVGTEDSQIIHGRKVQLCENTVSHTEDFIPNVTYVTFQNYEVELLDNC